MLRYRIKSTKTKKLIKPHTVEVPENSYYFGMETQIIVMNDILLQQP